VTAAPEGYDSLVALSLNALRVRLPGVVTWQRPRSQPLRQGGQRTAYPDAYVAGRGVWQLYVAQAVAQTGWQRPPVRQPLMVEAEIVAGGKLDTDRVLTAVLDALQNGGALVDDCRVWELHVVRRRPEPPELPHVDVVLSRAEEARREVTDAPEDFD